MNLSKLILAGILAFTVASAVACATSSEDTKFATGSGGTGTGTSGSTTSSSGSGAGGDDLVLGSGGAASTGSGSGGEDCNVMLLATVRDFQRAHPDFEAFLGSEKGIVKPDLGADGKPVYNGNPATAKTSGKANFDQWYRDVPEVNLTFPTVLQLKPAGQNIYTYDNQAYFPVDNQGFGSEGFMHNYHFTTEIHTQFTYKGGEVFKFIGDDDLFAYINKKLVIDLGGVHGEEEASVELDAVAASIGITLGNSYPLDLFGAERHTSGSHFRIDTTIGCFTPQPPPK